MPPASVENVATSKKEFLLTAELKHVPIAFANALRRISLAELPVVVPTDIEIVENTTHLSHEMLKHRVLMLPINVRPEEADVIRETRVEVRYHKLDAERVITTADFNVTGPRTNVLLLDRDLGTPLHFLTMKPGSSLHITFSLGVSRSKAASHVCVSTFRNHVDEEQAKTDRKLHIENGGDPRVFDNFLIQRSFAVNEAGRPYWFDFTLESIGVLPAKDILRRSAVRLKEMVGDFVATATLEEEGETGWYRVVYGEANAVHTVGQLAQEMLYPKKEVLFVGRDAGHPLVPQLTLRIHTDRDIKELLTTFQEEATELCENILSSV